MFLLIVLSILAAIYGYTGWRLITPAPLYFPWKVAAWAAALLLMLLPPGLMLLRDRVSKAWWGDLLAWITYLNLGFATLTFSLLVVRDLIWLVLIGLDQLVSLVGLWVTAEAQSLMHIEPDRQQHLLHSTNLGALGLASVLSGYGLYQARRCARVKEVCVPIDELPEALEGFRIAQISDIHAGPTIKRPYVQAIVNQVNTLDADLIAFTGDLADRPVPQLQPHVAPLSQLRARHGCYFVTGNHEYYAGAEAWIAAIKDLGFAVLLNQHRLLRHNNSRILLAGVTDLSAGEMLPHHASDPEAAIAHAPPSDVRILLAHQPRSVFAAARAGFDLQLSGHTHGGQFVPWKYLIRLQQPYIAGLHRFERTWIYVNRGTGYWGPPLRLGAPAEITLITLRRA